MAKTTKFNPVVWYQPEMTEKDVFNKARELMKDNTTDAEALYTYMCKVKYQELQEPHLNAFNENLDKKTGDKIHTFIKEQSKQYRQIERFLKTLEDIVAPKEPIISKKEDELLEKAIMSKYLPE